MNNFFVRRANKQDLGEISRIYSTAREFMRKTGNPSQWTNGYPQLEILCEDIDKGRLYLVESQERVVGAFVFFIGEEPVYNRIEAGKWKSKSDCGVLHRVASDGSEKGVFGAVYKFAKERSSEIRIDTHADNLVMQKTLAKYGFERAGIVYLSDGAERIAYESI